MDSRRRMTYNEAGAKVLGTTIGVVSQRDLGGLLVKSFTVKNNGPAPLTAGSLEFSPDQSTWLGYDGTTFGTLGSAAVARVLIQNDSTRYWRFRSNVASGSVATVNFWWEF